MVLSLKHFLSTNSPSMLLKYVLLPKVCARLGLKQISIMNKHLVFTLIFKLEFGGIIQNYRIKAIKILFIGLG